MRTESYDPDALGLEVVRYLSGSEVLVKCPYHDDTNPSAEYNVEKGLFYCFGCHESKTAKELAHDLGGSLVPVAVSRLRRLRDAGDAKGWLDLYRNPLAVGDPYLAERQVTDLEVLRFGIRANEDGVIFPILDRLDRPTGAQIRHYTKEPKYMTFGDRQPVWPMNMLMWARPAKVFVTEGVFGVLRAHRAGHRAVCIMGSGNVADAAEQLLNAGTVSRAYAVMDHDYAGLLAAGKFVLHGIPAIVWGPIRRTAPDEWTTKEWDETTKRCEEWATYDVMDIIEAEPRFGGKLMRQLKKYWRKMT